MELEFVKIYSKLLESGDEERYIYSLKDYTDKYIQHFTHIKHINKYLFYLEEQNFLLAYKVSVLFYVLSQIINNIICFVNNETKNYVTCARIVLNKMIKFKQNIDSYKKMLITEDFQDKEIICSHQDSKYNKIKKHIDENIVRIEIIDRLLNLKKTFGMNMLKLLKFLPITYDESKMLNNDELILYYNNNIKKITKSIDKCIKRCNAILDVTYVINSTILTFDVTIPLKNFEIVITD
jgi:hypothetical protein